MTFLVCLICLRVFTRDQFLLIIIAAVNTVADRLSPTRQLMTPIKVDSSPGTPSNYSPASSDILISSSWSVSSGMCVVCKIDFGSLKDLTDHVQEAHNYKCEVRLSLEWVIS